MTRKGRGVRDLPATAKTKEQRRKILQAAYLTIAEKGFEGLRMREIGARAGLNHSTLHYYFAGKEALISGVMDYMVKELSLGREATLGGVQLCPRDELTSHFAALVRQAREQPAMFVVLVEIHARSTRDPGIRSVMSANERTWKKFIVRILRRGMGCGDFDPNLDAEVAAEAILALIRGLNVGSSASLARAERALQQLTTWLTGYK
jgi:AcrR family transcriptional regulator